MCGIFGFNFNDRNLAKSMINLLKHRGPNHDAIYEDNSLTLGYTRLSVIDLKYGKQPIYNENESLIIFYNGEIYNYLELKKKLEQKGHKFVTKSDTEVVLHAYEEYGYECLKKFNGMFAFVIYDLDKKELFIARDRLGIKPLYLYKENNKFIFSSEMKAILSYKEVSRKISMSALNDYLTYRYCTGKQTMLSKIQKLEPGHYLVYKNEKIRIVKYWQLQFKETNETFQIAKIKFRKLLEKSVNYRMKSDVPIGALLSGGIDSSSIVAMMANNSNQSIKTYTLGFENSKMNEFRYARVISEQFNTDHKEFTIDSTYLKILPNVIWHLDEPIADPTAISNFVLAQKASKDVKVLLNGEGADEFLMGYEQYKKMTLLKYYNKFPKVLRKTVLTTLKLLPKEPFFYKLQEFINIDKNIPKSYQELVSIFGSSEKRMLLRKQIYESDIDEKTKKYFDNKLDFYTQMSYHDISTFLPDNMLVKFDKTTMAHSIEGRVPFCDHNIAEFSASLPVKYKFNKMDKFILRSAMNNLLPKEILNRPKQRFFVPTDIWFDQGYKDYAKNLLNENQDIVSHFFDKNYINKLLNKDKLFSNTLLKFGKMTKLYYTRQLWTISNFIQWYDIFIHKSKVKGKNSI